MERLLPRDCCVLIGAMALVLAISGCRPTGSATKGSSTQASAAVESASSSDDTAAAPQTDRLSATPEAAATEVRKPDNENRPLRTLWLTRQRPVIIDWRMTLDDRPWRDASLQLVTQLLEEADRDHDRRTTWEEFLTDERYQRGQLGTASFESARQRKDLVFERDIDADGMVDETELLTLLYPGQHHVEPIRWRAETRSPAEPLAPLLLECDQDRDGAWSSVEIEAVRIHLKQRDANDDGWVTRREWSGRTAAEPSDSPPTSSRDAMPSMFVLHAGTNWEQLLFELEWSYSRGIRLQAEDFADPASFARVDTDRDGAWDARELAAACAGAADVIVDVGWREAGAPSLRATSATSEGDRQVTSIPVTCDAPGVTDVAGPSLDGTRAVLRLGADQLDIVIPLDRSTDDDRTTLTKTWEGLLGEHPDRPVLTADSYRSLEPLVGVGFQGVDIDRDGEVTWSEVERVWNRRQALARSRLAVTVTEGDDRLWDFIDRDGDGRLSTREQMEMTALLVQQVQAAGSLTFEAFPRRARCEIRRDTTGQAAEPMTGAVGAREIVESGQSATPTQTPAWFRAWDRNRDGEVSREEFLGTNEQFERFDRDHDQFWEVDELP